MKGDAWKYKKDSDFIRQVIYFLRNLQIECERFNCWMIQPCKMAFENGHRPPRVISWANVDTHGISFHYGNRQFHTCRGCGDIIEKNVDLYPGGGLYRVDHGVCPRCEPEEYKKEGEKYEKKRYPINCSGCPNYPD